MASIERTAYPRFKPSLTANELQTLYEPTEEERDFVSTHTRGETQQLTLLTLLKCQQHLGYLPALTDVPDDIRTYLCQQLHLLPLMDGHAEAESPLYRYHQLIRVYLDIKPYGEGGQNVVETAVQQAAYTGVENETRKIPDEVDSTLINIGLFSRNEFKSDMLDCWPEYQKSTLCTAFPLFPRAA